VTLQDAITLEARMMHGKRLDYVRGTYVRRKKAELLSEVNTFVHLYMYI